MTDMEILHTFNCGYGMIVITNQHINEKELDYLGTIIESERPLLL